MSHPFGPDQGAGNLGLGPNAMSPRRHQVLDAFPFLKGILPGTPGERWYLRVNSVTYPLTPPQREAIWNAVDQERPLVPLLSEYLGWEPWMVSHVQHHWPVFDEIDGLYAHHAWDLRALLASWTPETAPSSLAPLRHLCGLFNFDLYNRGLVRVRSFHELPKRALSADERGTLLEILEDGSRYQQLCEYLDFLHTLTNWLSHRTGKYIGGIIPRLLAAETTADWWTLCLRWHRINEHLRHKQAMMDIRTAAPETRSLDLLTKPVHIGVYSFHNVRNPLSRPRVQSSVDPSQDVPSLQTPAFPNITVYVELDGNFHATLTLAIGGRAGAPRIRVVAAARESGWLILDDYTQAAVDQFVAGCNEGHIVIDQKTVNFYLSGAILRAWLLVTLQCLDYPSWLALFPATDYFEAHNELTATAVFDAYRKSLSLFETAEDCIYQRSVAATRRVGEPDFEFIECVMQESNRTLVGPPEYTHARCR